MRNGCAVQKLTSLFVKTLTQRGTLLQLHLLQSVFYLAFLSKIFVAVFATVAFATVVVIAESQHELSFVSRK